MNPIRNAGLFKTFLLLGITLLAGLFLGQTTPVFAVNTCPTGYTYHNEAGKIPYCAPAAKTPSPTPTPAPVITRSPCPNGYTFTTGPKLVPYCAKSGSLTPTPTTSSSNNNSSLNNIEELPATGSPFPVWILAGFLPAGWALRRFGRSKHQT